MPYCVAHRLQLLSFRSFWRLAFALLLVTGTVGAFPPAPYYTLYGMVRDQVGQVLRVDGAELLLLNNGIEIGRASIRPDLQLDQNYELSIRIDLNRSGTSIYNERAVRSQGLFSLAVEMNGALFYPIEVAGTLRAGTGGERVRLDLNLGEDSDKDGLPDVWEEWQLYQGGAYPDESGQWDLSRIDRNGDFDHDGQSNLLEYIAGTFAGDATETFSLAIREKLSDRVRFEFFAVAGKVYTIERTADFKTWKRVPFTVGSPGPGMETYQATTLGILPAFAVPGGDASEFYRLTVR
jgi:hypothetical protein